VVSKKFFSPQDNRDKNRLHRYGPETGSRIEHFGIFDLLLTKPFAYMHTGYKILTFIQQSIAIFFEPFSNCGIIHNSHRFKSFVIQKTFSSNSAIMDHGYKVSIFFSCPFVFFITILFLFQCLETFILSIQLSRQKTFSNPRKLAFIRG